VRDGGRGGVVEGQTEGRNFSHCAAEGLRNVAGGNVQNVSGEHVSVGVNVVDGDTIVERLDVKHDQQFGGRSVDLFYGTKLYESLQEKFDVIFFPFPRASLYHGAYENEVDLKANQELMKKFFSCMRSHLEPNGRIVLIFNHLENQPKIPQFTNWKVESLAKKANFTLTEVQPFNPADLSLYVTRQVTGKHWKPSFASVYVFERAEKAGKSKRTKRKREAEFDLWPREKKVRSNAEVEEGRWFRDSFINSDAECITLLPGLVLLRNWLTLEGQQKIVDTCRSLSKHPGGFYTPTYESGAKVKLRQMCLGWHWDIVAEKYEKSRTNFDGAPVVEMTEEFRELCRKCLVDAAKIDPDVMGERTKVDMDICVLNFYTHRGRNGLHVDKDESPETMSAGSPIVSFSIGYDADFAYTEHTIEEVRNSNVEVPVVKLRSGDALCFGGPSRMLTHALTRVYADTAPELLHMTPGRLNLTFREL